MKGMELSRAYFEEFGRPMIEKQFAGYMDSIAAGLVGEGSECFGFDDEFSRDHDFGPGFCIWLPQEVYTKTGAAMKQAYEALPAEWQGVRRIQSPQGGGRVGVFSIEEFYQRYTGLTHAPKDNMEWLRIPQSFLAKAVNGQVFCDYRGTFTEIRNILKGFYPIDVVRKKLAAKTAVMAQSGQYNYPRCMKRGDCYAAYMSCCEFVNTALSAVFLLNESYMPFYKWAFRAAQELTLLKGVTAQLRELVMLPDSMDNRSRKEWIIENICIEIGRELNRRGLTLTTDTFLQSHGEELMRSISDSRLKNMHIMVDQD